MSTDIAGYTYDTALAASPVSLDDLNLLLATLLWTDDDAAALARAGIALESQVDQVLDVWYGYVGSSPHLVASFNGADGQPSGDYLTAVRARFGQWIRDLCNRPWDQQWLDYQHEIARRHTDTMGDTDHVTSDQTHIPQRYLIAFIWPITATIRPFLANAGTDDADIDAMHTAWFKAVTLTALRAERWGRSMTWAGRLSPRPRHLIDLVNGRLRPGRWMPGPLFGHDGLRHCERRDDECGQTMISAGSGVGIRLLLRHGHVMSARAHIGLKFGVSEQRGRAISYFTHNSHVWL
ncbi:MAG: protoglobin domain-containing protein [Microthrixaceae bacterium]